MWSIFVNVIATLCYSQNKEKSKKKRDKKTTKSRLKISQMFLLYPQYLKLQSWFSNDFSLGFFISAIFMLFYFIVFFGLYRAC